MAAEKEAVAPEAISDVWLLSARTGGAWKKVMPEEGAKPAPPFEAGCPEGELQRTLSDVALSQHLALLVGLGPSVGVGGPKMTDLWDRIGAATGEQFARVAETVGFDLANPDIEAFLTRCHLSEQLSAKADVTDFISKAEGEIFEACTSFLNGRPQLPDHETFLRKLARRPPDRSRTRVFTTNYDLCLEQAARSGGFAVIDGFGHIPPPLFDSANFDTDFVRRSRDDRAPEYLESVFQLFKLHGSVNWEQRGAEIVRAEKPERPVLIYPRGDKFELSYQQPFIELIGRFHAYLRQPHLGLLIVGFGFTDMHLSETILGAVQRNTTLKVVVATQDARSQSADPRRKMLGRLLKLASAGDPRLTLIDISFAKLVQLFPDLGQPSEGEQLKSLIAKVLREA